MKFMNMKRFASLVMASIMALSLAVPAFASNTTVITGTYQEVEIAVEVPTTGEAQINPYGLPVEIAKSDKTTATISDQQITTQPMSLKNQGATPLDVNASLLVKPTGDVSIATSVGTDKAITVNLEVVGLDDSELALDASSRSLEDKVIDKFVDEANWDGAATLAAPAYPKGATGAAIPAPAKSPSAMASLGAATVEGRTITYGAKSIAMVRLSGEVAEAPVTGTSPNTVDAPWATTDGFEATVVFSFKPTPTYSITITTAGTGGTCTANVTKAYAGDTITLTSTPNTTGHTVSYAITYNDGSSKTITPEADGSFTMVGYPVAVVATFSAP